jgi:hypothetical protein
MSTEVIHSLIPLPQSFRKDEGRFNCKPTLTIAFETCSDEVSHAGKLLEEWLKVRQPELTCEVFNGSSDIRFLEENSDNEEAYTLTITPDQITIRAVKPDGYAPLRHWSCFMIREDGTLAISRMRRDSAGAACIWMSVDIFTLCDW